METSVKLNIGCGNKRREGFVGIDKYPCAAADIVCDITTGIPCGDDTVDEVIMDNVIEHILDIPAVMREVHRVCKHGAKVTIITPHFSSLTSWRDPTHIHHLSYFSFDHFAKENTRHYMGCQFEVVNRRLSFVGGPGGLIGRFIFWLSPRKYEQNYCFIFRASTLTFGLQAVKNAPQAG